MLIEFLKAHEAVLAVGLYFMGMVGGLSVLMAFAYLVEPPLKTVKQYNHARCVANIGFAVMVVIVPVVTGVLCYVLS